MNQRFCISLMLGILFCGCGGENVKITEERIPIDPRIAQGAVIVCGHVAEEGAPILRAIRGKPVDPDDTGWQVLCDSGKDESVDEAQVWSVKNVIDREPTLRDYMSLEVGTEVVRESKRASWTVVK